MNIVQRAVKALFGVTWGTPGANTWTSATEWNYGLLNADPINISDPYTQSATVAMAISTIATDAASIRWEMYPARQDPNQADEIEDHPVLDLWRRPNQHMSGLQLWSGSYLSFKLWGETHWYYPDLILGRSGGARASRRSNGVIHLLDPRAVILKFTDDGEPQWFLRRDGNDIPLDSTRLTTFKRTNPYNQFRGMSELESLRIEIEGDWAASSWNRNYFSNQNGVPAGLLLPNKESVLRIEDRDQMERQFNSKHARLKRSVGVLPPGWTWQDLGVSQRDMDFKGLREYSREQILAALGLPPFYAGVLDKANYANAREQKDVYWNGTINRLLAEFQSTINADFLPKIGVEDVEVWPCWESVKAQLEDLSEKADIATKLFSIGFTKAQINDRLELGFDMTQNEDADVGYLPLGLMPVDQMDEPRTVAGPIGGQADNADAEEGAGDREAARSSVVKRAEVDPVARETRRVASWRSLAFRTLDLERQFNKLVRRVFRDIEAEALQASEGLRGWAVSQGIRKAVEDDPFDAAKAKKKLQDGARPIYAEALRRGQDSVLAEIGVEISLPLQNPLNASELARLMSKVVGIVDTVRDELRDALGASVAAGDSPQQLAKRIAEVMDASKNRSMTIARTETGQAFMGGRYNTMVQVGVDKIEWITARDAKVRDSHQIDGDVTSIGTPFRNGLLYPLDPNGTAEDVINCRCVAVSVID